jgi:hypothetical protein
MGRVKGQWGEPVAETPRIHLNLLLTLFFAFFFCILPQSVFVVTGILDYCNGKRCISVTGTKTNGDPPPGGEYIEPMGTREMAPAKGVAGGEESRGQEEPRGLC